MKMNKKLIYTALILIVFGTALAQIIAIPSYGNIQGWIIIIAFLIAYFAGIIYSVKFWKLNYKSRKQLMLINWIKSSVISIIIIGGIPFVFSIVSISAAGGGLYGPEFIKEIKD